MHSQTFTTDDVSEWISNFMLYSMMLVKAAPWHNTTKKQKVTEYIFQHNKSIYRCNLLSKY